MRPIDAHKLEEEFKRIYNVTESWQSLDWGTIKNTIRDQPAVDPVKHAHWIFRNKYYRYWCSVCGQPMDYEYNYCPNCGCKMDDEVTK